MALRHCIRQSKAFVNACRSCSISSKKMLNVTVNDENGITTVTMNRPPVNALNFDFLTELSETFHKFEQSKPAGVVLTSFSDKVFSTGLDLNEIIKPNPLRFKAFWARLHDVMKHIYGSSCLTVAVINGHAPAGGCFLSLCCDYRIMLNNFTIGLNETRVGIPVPPWLILAMQETIDKRRTELALTSSQLFNTNEALKIGLIDEIATNKTDAFNKAMAFFKKYELISPLARKMTKSELRRPVIEYLHTIREKEVDHISTYMLRSDVQQHIGDYLIQIKRKK